MKFFAICIPLFVLFYDVAATNLTCYQCTRQDNNECGPEFVKPCGSSFDRCAIHKIKTTLKGLEVKRECGLAPCEFDDVMTEKSLGMNCDTDQDEFYCTYCCKENNCNKNRARILQIVHPVTFIITSLIFISNMYSD